MVKREDCTVVGTINKTHGLQGCVVISSDNDFLEKYAEEPVFIQLDGAPVPFFIAKDGLAVRNSTSYVVKFDFVDNTEQAEALVGSDVMMEKSLIGDEENEECGDDEFMIEDLIEFEVFDENDKKIGVVTDAADYSGNMVLSIAHISGKEIMLPVSEEFILHIDFENQTMTADIPQSIMDLY